MSVENRSPNEGLTASQIEQIRELARSIRYGSITLIFQDGLLIQIDKNEKIRVSKP